jgi:nucleoside-diphosphate-sugar epimerase
MSKILITGGAGYLGSILCEELLKSHDFIGVEKVTVLDNLLYKQDGLFPFSANKRFEFVYGDVRNTDLLGKLLQNHDVVIPLAAIVGMPACKKDKALATDVNLGQIQFITGNCPFGTKVIYPDTNSVYGTPKDGKIITEESEINIISHYADTKYRAEKEVLAYGGIALRLATVFGSSYRFRKDLLVNDFVLRAVTDKFIVLFEANFKRNYVHVRDVADAFITMMVDYDQWKGHVFNLGLSENYSKLELCQKIKEHVPEFVIKTDEFAKDPDKRNYEISNEKILKTGWKADHDLDFGIDELIKGYKILTNANTKYTNL